LTDRLGTVRDVVRAAGSLLNHLDYDSFGNIVRQMNAAAADRFTFTGAVDADLACTTTAADSTRAWGGCQPGPRWGWRRGNNLYRYVQQRAERYRPVREVGGTGKGAQRRLPRAALRRRPHHVSG
jgi:hypothetical protein